MKLKQFIFQNHNMQLSEENGVKKVVMDWSQRKKVTTVSYIVRIVGIIFFMILIPIPIIWILLIAVTVVNFLVIRNMGKLYLEVTNNKGKVELHKQGSLGRTDIVIEKNQQPKLILRKTMGQPIYKPQLEYYAEGQTHSIPIMKLGLLYGKPAARPVTYLTAK
mgnify:FL=1